MTTTAARTAGVDVHWQPTFADLGTPLSQVSFVVVDLETTGMHAGQAGITEIGAVKVRGGEVLGEFESLVNAGKPVSAFIARLTGITQAMVSTAPRIDLVMPSFLEWAHGCVLVAHNASFDVGFLRAACRELGYQWPGYQVVDTLGLARRVVTKDEVRNHKLESLAAFFNADVNPNHRALADARATVDVFHGLLGRLGAMGVTHLEDLASAADPVPADVRRKATLADGLPEGPGVYQFIGPKDEVLYVGTSNNIKKRVRSYFTAAEKRKQITEMVRIAHRVQPIVCATALEAAVRELRLIAEHSPRYNRASKKPDKVFWLRLTDEAFPRLAVSRQVKGDSPHIGPFTSMAAAAEAQAVLQSVIPIRQCAGSVAKAIPCAIADMGRCLAPCDPASEPEYASAVAAVTAAMSGDPSAVLTAYTAKVAAYAQAEQFEAAGLAASRLQGYLKAAAKAQHLLPLAACPELVAARPAAPAPHLTAAIPGGIAHAITNQDPAAHHRSRHGWELIVAKHGKLAGTAVVGPECDLPEAIRSLRLTAEHVPAATPPMPAGLVAEAQLVLNWLNSDDVRLVHAETPWALPVKSAVAHVDLSAVSEAVAGALTPTAAPSEAVASALSPMPSEAVAGALSPTPFEPVAGVSSPDPAPTVPLAAPQPQALVSAA